MESSFLITNVICLTSSSGEGFSLNFTVLIKARGNFVARCWPASISIFDSPKQIKFVTAPSSNSFIVDRKAWIFHWWESPGKTCSYVLLAEMTLIFFILSATDGIYQVVENSTHPSAAFVIMNTYPCCIAKSKISQTAFSSIFKEFLSVVLSSNSSTCPFGCKNEVQSKVSSQSNMMHVYYRFG